MSSIDVTDPNYIKFKRLAREWRRKTGGCSIMARAYADPAYQEILTMGPCIVPYIIEELREKPARWFSALRELTGEDASKGLDTFDAAVKAWINWWETKQ